MKIGHVVILGLHGGIECEILAGLITAERNEDLGLGEIERGVHLGNILRYAQYQPSVTTNKWELRTVSWVIV